MKFVLSHHITDINIITMKLTCLASFSSSAGYHFWALAEGAGTSRVDFPNFLVVGFADIVSLGLCLVGLWRGKEDTFGDARPKCWNSL